MSEITVESIPRDDAPPVGESTGDFDPDYPGSTPDAPYGFKPDGTAYKRRPRGTAGGSTATTRGAMPASNAQATQAAALLARANLLLAMAIGMAGLGDTASQITKNNDSFEIMARDALLADPALCRKILGAGTTSGKAGLAMAYVMLGGSVFATAKNELADIRADKESENEDALHP